MGSGSMWQARVVCPFYRTDDNLRIVCEGIVEDSNFITLFRFKSLKIQQMRIFCCENYKNCEVYRMLMDAKYEEWQ